MTLDRPRRVALLGSVLILSLMYVLQLINTLAPADRELFVWIKISAGLSWPIFGLALYLPTRWKPTVWRWFDICLLTMCPGLLIMVGSAFANGLIPVHARVATQLVILGVTNLVMLAIFAYLARRSGVSMRAILATWVGGLLAPFAVILTILCLATGAA